MKQVLKIYLNTGYKCLISYNFPIKYCDYTFWFNSYNIEKIEKVLDNVEVNKAEEYKDNLSFEGLTYAQDMIRIKGELKNYLKYHDPIVLKRFSCGSMSVSAEYIDVPEETDFE